MVLRKNALAAGAAAHLAARFRDGLGDEVSSLLTHPTPSSTVLLSPRAVSPELLKSVETLFLDLFYVQSAVTKPFRKYLVHKHEVDGSKQKRLINAPVTRLKESAKTVSHFKSDPEISQLGLGMLALSDGLHMYFGQVFRNPRWAVAQSDAIAALENPALALAKPLPANPLKKVSDSNQLDPSVLRLFEAARLIFSPDVESTATPALTGTGKVAIQRAAKTLLADPKRLEALSALLTPNAQDLAATTQPISSALKLITQAA